MPEDNPEEYLEDYEDEEIEDELEEELGIFKDQYKECEEFNNHLEKYAKDNLEGYRAEIFLESEKTDLEPIREEIQTLVSERQILEEKQLENPMGSQEIWDDDEKLCQKESRMRDKLTLLAAGLTMSHLADLSDDNLHIIEDSYDEDGGELRKELKEQLGNLSRTERETIIEQLYEDEEIDHHQYNYLKTEFN